jgi:TetR/AcrR family transcriptional repressor of nem operon
MRYDDDHKEKTRTKVLQVAARAIRKDGPDRVGVAAVMAEAGLTHGGFYAHFKSKDDLVTEAIRQMFRDARGRFREITGERPAADALTAYIAFYLSHWHRDVRGVGCPLPSLSADLARLPPAAQAVFGDGVGGLTDFIAEKLEAMGKAEPHSLATSVLSELVGAVTLARAVADPAQSDAILKASRAALHARLGLEALR